MHDVVRSFVANTPGQCQVSRAVAPCVRVFYSNFYSPSMREHGFASLFYYALRAIGCDGRADGGTTTASGGAVIASRAKAHGHSSRPGVKLPISAALSRTVNG
eukprot:2483629-Prymnesium_polylepis.1